MPLTATEPRRRSLASLSLHGFHRVVYFEWGDPANDRVVICVHGVSRNGRDFDVLGEALASTHRVLAVDMPGRGASEWLADPNDYTFPTYLTALTALIARSGATHVSWVGTSMGGFIGMFIAALPRNPIHKLVLNDAGMFIPRSALSRLAQYVGKNPRFASLEELEAHIAEAIEHGLAGSFDIEFAGKFHRRDLLPPSRPNSFQRARTACSSSGEGQTVGGKRAPPKSGSGS